MNKINSPDRSIRFPEITLYLESQGRTQTSTIPSSAPVIEVPSSFQRNIELETEPGSKDEFISMEFKIKH